MEGDMMNKKWKVFPVVLMILTGLVFGAVFFSCDNSPSGPPAPKVDTYKGTDTDGKQYELKVTDNKTYELKIDGESISTGKASLKSGEFTLTPNSDGDSFTVTVERKKITKIEGSITPDDDSEPIEPGEIVTSEPVVGVWNWYTIDDSKPNKDKVDPQTIFAPGGASKITNATKDDETQETNKPFIHPAGTVKDNNGKAITETVYGFKGNTKVTKDNRSASEGARFPLVGWEAEPDEETLEALKTAYGYQFWIRVNSSTASNWAFLTAVVTDFTPEKGYEYKHWFGNQAGDSGGNTKVNNFTGNLAVGKWHQIMVIMDSSAINMEQDKWIHTYNPEYKGKFNQNKAQRVQWQIPLQHQVGADVSARSGEPYDIIRGSYTFDVDFYGLELLVE
jgi:hypothetical protein